MKVECDITKTLIMNEHGREVPGVVVSCTRCSYSTESFGQGDGSVRRCMMLLKEQCPNGERNYYTEGTVRENPAPRVRPPVAGARSMSATPQAAAAVPASSGIPRVLRENDFVVLETETTGLSTKNDQIIQIGLVQVDRGIAARWRMQTNIKPTKQVNPKAAEINGLTNERLANAPSFASMAPDIVAQLANRVVVGYNCLNFDMPMLERQLGEAGLVAAPLAVLDVLVLERRLAKDFPEEAAVQSPSHKLGDACTRWGVTMDPTREAISNCKAVWGVFVTLCRRFPQIGESSLEQLLEMQSVERAIRKMGVGQKAGEGYIPGTPYTPNPEIL